MGIYRLFVPGLMLCFAVPARAEEPVPLALAAAKSGREPAATNRATMKPVGEVPYNARVLMYPRSTLIERLEGTGPAPHRSCLAFDCVNWLT